MVKLSPDLVAAVIQIIDMCAKQGVFVGPNLSVAGQVRGELERALTALNENSTVKTEASEK